jgi:pimeloyl-ACP methyl ester carboxylesterase
MDGDTIVSRKVTVESAKLHYLTAGHGPTLMLLHGYTQTSRMWRPIIPLLAEKFTVIAPDLPGIGDSAIPKDGLDMKTAAMSIHALAKSIAVEVRSADDMLDRLPVLIGSGISRSILENRNPVSVALVRQ